MGSRRYEYADRSTVPKKAGAKQTMEEFLSDGGEVTQVDYVVPNQPAPEPTSEREDDCPETTGPS
jgi:hypothetical protein